jgi:hypothetical protein
MLLKGGSAPPSRAIHKHVACQPRSAAFPGVLQNHDTQVLRLGRGGRSGCAATAAPQTPRRRTSLRALHWLLYSVGSIAWASHTTGFSSRRRLVVGAGWCRGVGCVPHEFPALALAVAQDAAGGNHPDKTTARENGTGNQSSIVCGIPAARRWWPPQRLPRG